MEVKTENKIKISSEKELKGLVNKGYENRDYDFKQIKESYKTQEENLANNRNSMNKDFNKNFKNTNKELNPNSNIIFNNFNNNESRNSHDDFFNIIKINNIEKTERDENFSSKNINSLLTNKTENKMEENIEENTGIRLPHYSDPSIDIQINQKITFEKLIMDINECLERLDDFENKFFELLTVKEISSKIIEKFYKNHLDFSIIKVYVFFLKRQLNLVCILTQIKFAKENEQVKIENLQKYLNLNYRKLLMDDENNLEEKIKFKKQLHENIKNLYSITKKFVEKYNTKRDFKKLKSLVDPSKSEGKAGNLFESSNKNIGDKNKFDNLNNHDFNEDLADCKKEFESDNKENFEFHFKDGNNKMINIDNDYFNRNKFKIISSIGNKDNHYKENLEKIKSVDCNNNIKNLIQVKNILNEDIVNENNNNTGKNSEAQAEIYLNSFNQNLLNKQTQINNQNFELNKINFNNQNKKIASSLIDSETENKDIPNTLKNNQNKVFLQNNLNLININQETVMDWLAEGDLRLDENINKMLKLEKIILEFYDAAENHSFKPSLTSIGVTVKIMSINTHKAIKLVSELSKLKKIGSEELAINFLTICNKFELYANFFLLSSKTPHDDLFNLPETSKEWQLIKSKLDKRVLFSRNSVNKKLEKVFSMITVGMASVSKGFKNKKNSLVNKIVQTGIYMPYFFLFRKNADIQTQKFAINPDFDVALLIWNIMDTKYVKNIIKVTMPNIKHSKKYFLQKEKEELTPQLLMDDYMKFLKKVKGCDKNVEELIEFCVVGKEKDCIKNYDDINFDLINEDHNASQEIVGKGKLKNESFMNKYDDNLNSEEMNNKDNNSNIKNLNQEAVSNHDKNVNNNYENNNNDDNKIKKNYDTKKIEKINNSCCCCCCSISPKKKLPNHNKNSQNTTPNSHSTPITENQIIKASAVIKKKSSKQTNVIEEFINTLHLENYVKVRFISSQDFIVPQHQSFWSKIISKKDHCNSPRESLIIHIHGGGWIAMSSSSHEMYTRKWSKMTDIPIMSIDYRLAPDNPYPKALDDVYQSYCWILKHAEEKLLMKVKNIILVGDSAGGNLASALTNLLIARGQRVPSGLFLIYPAMRVSMNAFSLSMLNVIDDKILPYHLVKFCLEAYRKDYDIEDDPFISPIYADDEMLKCYPPVRIYVGTNDPLRDDSFLFMKKLL